MEIGVYLYPVLFLILVSLYLFSRKKNKDTRSNRQRSKDHPAPENAETGEDEPKKGQ